MGSRRFLAILFAVFLVLAFSLSVGATTTTGEGSGTTVGGTATTVGVTTGETIVPAVPVEVTETPETQPDWTYRFFIPTLLILAALVVIATVVQYFTRVVRNRYRVIR
jgi:phosphatidylglycerophosphate synthase